jgi:hypothetical protein
MTEKEKNEGLFGRKSEGKTTTWSKRRRGYNTRDVHIVHSPTNAVFIKLEKV